MYEYFIGAESTSDVRVQTNDQIFLPIRGKTVSLTGQVKRPAIYELKAQETLEELLRFAGGFTAEAYLEKIKIRRILPGSQRTVGQDERIELDFEYASVSKAKQRFELVDGDEIVIRSVLDLRRNYVSITGAVYRPGTYQIEKFPTLWSVVKAADSVRREAYLGRVEVVRLLDDSTRTAFHLTIVDADAVCVLHATAGG